MLCNKAYRAADSCESATLCFMILSENNDQKLGNQNNCDKSYGIGSRICCSNVFCLGNIDKSAESRSGSHTAGKRTEVVQEAQFENILREEESENHGENGHDDTVNEVHDVEVCNKFSAAGDTCTYKEQHETELAEQLESVVVGHNAELADSAEVTKYERDEETAAGGGKREASAFKTCCGKRNLDLTNEGAENCCESEYAETVVVELEKSTGEGLLFFLRFSLYNELGAFEIHVSLGELGNELNEENHADYAEDVSDTVTYGYKAGERRVYGSLSCRECRSRGKRTGKKTYDHCGEAFRGFDGRTVADHITDTDTESCRKTACKDDNEAEKNVGLEVSLHVAEELGACDEANRSYEQDQTELFNNFECFFKEINGFGFTLDDHLSFQRTNEECTEEECNYKYTCITQGYTLDGDSAEGIANEQNTKNAEHQERNAGNRNNAAKKIHTVLNLTIKLLWHTWEAAWESIHRW